jgi:hypothetical protein
MSVPTLAQNLAQNAPQLPTIVVQATALRVVT